MAFNFIISVSALCIYGVAFWQAHKHVARKINGTNTSIIAGTFMGLLFTLSLIAATQNVELLKTAMREDVIWVLKGWDSVYKIVIMAPAVYAAIRLGTYHEMLREQNDPDRNYMGRVKKTFGQAVKDTVTSAPFVWIFTLVITILLVIKLLHCPFSEII